MNYPAVRVTSDLCIRIGDTRAPLTPSGGLRLAEQLARASFRKMLEDEAAAATAPRTTKRDK
jgi:hypothetical protein